MAGNANSGNRTGLPRPREDRPFYHALRREMARSAAGDYDAYAQLARQLMRKAADGDMQAIKELIDRLDGKAIQQIESHNVNENHYVRAPEKASADDWQKYLSLKVGRGMADAVAKDPMAKEKTNGSRNGKSH